MKTLYFSKIFLLWYYSNRRDLPWRSNNMVYNIWISEIIFQQTRISQGIVYYNNFIQRFPTLRLLAEASEEEVLKMWQGLGYYSRARNLFFTAKFISNELDGKFPSTFEEIKKLKGIGEYTAAAIASIAFNETVPAVDGNVIRVITRLFAINLLINSSKGKKQITSLAKIMIDPAHPGDSNQAIMEFGALQCTPRNPNCKECPLNKDCLAYKTDSVDRYPQKAGKPKITIRYFNYLVIDQEPTILFKKRINNDIWKNLYEFPLIETGESMMPEIFIYSEQWIKFFNHSSISITKISDEITHQLSHQRIIARFYFLNVPSNINFDSSFIPIDKKNIFALPVPKIIETILKNISSL
jgi:A/G-specific adenine glycosylase